MVSGWLLMNNCANLKYYKKAGPKLGARFFLFMKLCQLVLQPYLCNPFEKTKVLL
jgi:hypothetical protein